MWYGSLEPASAAFAPRIIDRDLAVLFIGWALGLVSSPITDAIRRHSAKIRLTRALRTELRSMQDALAWVVVHLASRRGVLTRSLLDALLSTLLASGQVAGRAKAVKMIESLTELEERGHGQAHDVSTDPRAPLPLRVHGVPLLDAHFYRLDLYSLETQRMLVDLHAGVQNYNQLADEARNYHLLTFGADVSKERLDALAANVETCYERAAETASDLVSRVAMLLQSKEMKGK